MFMDLTRQSKARADLASKEGRPIGRNSRPPYLEVEEIDCFMQTVMKETLNNHCLLYREVAQIVLFYFITYLYRHMIQKNIKNMVLKSRVETG
jgi:hypothetical protein